jgi:flagellar hook-length control protein FliK
VATAAITDPGQSSANGGAATANDDGDSNANSNGRRTRASASDVAAPAQETDAATSAAAAAATGTAPATSVAQPAAIQPSEVVNQIAHQADLYRLPGNRGVRIQLHPDDLGGVQVTVKYAVGGGIELHINAEHEATGSLVQAGWTQLRDALATQGISPDRLVMSITSPTSASQMDFSSNGGQSRYGSDSNAASSGQNGQSQQRQTPNEPREAQPGWTASPAPDTTLRAASPAASAHIDYRV